MGNMRFKVGDRVRIKSLGWYNENKDEGGYINCGSRAFFTKMSDWCGKILTINRVVEEFKYYCVSECIFSWTDEMIEGLVEEESANYSKVIDNGVSNPIIAKTSSATIDTDKGFYSYSDSDDNLEMEWNLPEGYIFKDENGNVINATKIVLEKKKKEYPKTYEECCKVMGIPIHGGIALVGNWCMEDGYIEQHLETLRALSKPLICRDAYWKIAGEEMGLGKPWEPDCTSGYFIPAIIYRSGSIQKVEVQYRNAIFSFPTEEMRDAFYENFKELINECKELL